MVTSFSSPVVLVHSLQTGVLSSRQPSVNRLVKGIKEDMQYLKEMAKDVPVAVTWDASINACIHGKDGSHDCTLNGQLWQAADRKPKGDENEETLNDYTERFGNEILRELGKIDIAAWFFRTGKIQAREVFGRSDIDDEPRKLIRRRRPEKIVSGNDFLAMYKYGMFPKSLLSHASKHHKYLVAPVAIGLGVAGVGALGRWFWEDIKKIGNEVAQIFQKPQKTAPVIEKPKDQPNHAHKSQSIDSKQPVERPVERPVKQPAETLPPPIPNEISSSPPIIPIDREELRASSDHYLFPFAEFPGILTETRNTEDLSSEPIEPLGPYSSGPVIHHPFGYPSEGDPAWGMVDKTKNSHVEELIQKWQAPSEVPAVVKSDAAVEVESLDNRGSFAASVARFRTPETSNANSPINRSPRHSLHSTGSDFQLSKGISSKDSEHIRSLSDIQKDLKANGVHEQDLINGISVARPRRPGSELQNSGTKRHGKVLSVEEKELLDQMMLEGMRGEQKGVSRIEEIPKLLGEIAKEQGQNERGGNIEDASVPAPQADLVYLL